MLGAAEMEDQYDSFAALAKSEIKGIDYDIEIHECNSAVAIIAPHGGEIEPETTLIAKSIAQNQYNFYSFIPLKAGRNHSESAA